jgi:glycosyltransferase involved in cell wall biosynthesis
MAVVSVSVIVPTRNRAHLLPTTLRSVLRQREVDFEVVVVDDASTDDTAAVIGGCGDSRVRLLRHAAARGPNAARNSGARKAFGGWIAFIDDDDVWAPDKLLRQLRAAEETSRGWVYAGAVNVNEDFEVIHGTPPMPPDETLAALARYNAIPASASNVMVRRALFAEQGGFNEDLRVCEEWDLWLRLARTGPPAWVAAPLVGYRMHPASASLNPEAVLEGARAIEELHGVRLDWGRMHWCSLIPATLHDEATNELAGLAAEMEPAWHDAQDPLLARNLLGD